MIEKILSAVAPQALTADGTSLGLVTLASTAGFVVKQTVTLQGSALADLAGLEVKRVISSTQLVVGPVNQPLNLTTDISLYTVSATSTITAAEQARPRIPLTDAARYVFAEEPVVANRSILVDQFGNMISNSNPLAVNATVSVGDIDVATDVQYLDSALGISSFSLASANIIKSAIDISKYARGSIQIDWTGATSSDSFVSLGTFSVLIGNTSSPAAVLTTITVSAASGSFLYRGLDADIKYIAIQWTKNNSTGGSATISANFKGA